MSVIDPNPFAGTFGQPMSSEAANAAATGAGALSTYAQPADDISFAPTGPLPQPGQGSFGSPWSAESGAGGGWNFSGIVNQIGSLIANLFNQLGALLAGQGGSSPGSPGQTFYARATGSSVGDPHLAFNGTTAAGTTSGDRWNNMQSHPDLLDSNSFAGGYRVSTVATSANAAGITENASASITTGNGAIMVTLDGNGAYAINENGQPVTLTSGGTTSLGNGESVILGADGALTVVDQNAQGGSISTTLTAANGHVDVSSTAQNVDLGGYLVNRGDAAFDPVTFDPEAQATSLQNIVSGA